MLILLFADKVGGLRVVLTIRSAGLKNCEFWFRLFVMVEGLGDDLCDAGEQSITSLYASKLPHVLHIASILG